MEEAINRKELHKVCKEALTFNKRVIFAAIMDSSGRIIVGARSAYSKRCDENGCKGLIFYQDHLLPVLTSMTGYGGHSSTNKVCPKIQSQMLKVGLRNRISVAHLHGNSNSCQFLVVYWNV
ncbi:hypothetical protein [Nitrososphaera sp. AFS]|uniref:hypothetical protein n=1 Tax=Nitrososphaera sp. AFS TaxID=2301191 RepID=UPI0013921F08|nr:hypothetical protein [Nitrososphaera sp. AFS]NAL76928.1 hypothetical protein [Nitrososphaera sp. AFS]